jgi:hypothetical protein
MSKRASDLDGACNKIYKKKVRILQEESNKDVTESNKSEKEKEMITKCDHGSEHEQNDITTSGNHNLPSTQNCSKKLAFLINYAMHIL